MSVNENQPTYQKPEVTVVGSVGEITKQATDKIGSTIDALTPTLGLDGSIVPDP